MGMLLVSGLDGAACSAAQSNYTFFLYSFLFFFYGPAFLFLVITLLRGNSLRVLGISYGISTLVALILTWIGCDVYFMLYAAPFIYWVIWAAVKTFHNYANEIISNYRGGEGYLDTGADPDDGNDEPQTPAGDVE